MYFSRNIQNFPKNTCKYTGDQIKFNSSGTPLFNNNLLRDKQNVDKVKQHI